MTQEKSQEKPLHKHHAPFFQKVNQLITAFSIIAHQMTMNERFNFIGLNINLSFFCEKTFGKAFGAKFREFSILRGLIKELSGSF